MKTKTLLIALIILILITLVIYAINLLYLMNDSTPLNTVSESEAINSVVVQNPELVKYQNTSLPPSSIESKKTISGWYLGFVTKGSGIAGILDAKCYFMKNDKSITLIGEYVRDPSLIVTEINLETCKPLVSTYVPLTPTTPTTPTIPPTTTSGLKLGELGFFNTVSIRPISVEEDSRCPVDVVCIQAGTVRLKIQVITSTTTNTNIVTLNQELITAGVKIKLTEVTPVKNSKINIQNTDYRFKFSVLKQDTTSSASCFVGGCSSQVCSDKKDVISTCEYSPQYACYKTAKCERQSTGECGWTPTADLNACLVNNR
jgi:hypothetical protein